MRKKRIKRAPSSARLTRSWPDVKPDIDKLARAVLDGITGIVIRDDAQGVEISVRATSQDAYDKERETHDGSEI